MPEDPDLGPFRVLVVDDSPTRRRALRSSLEKKGYIVREAGDGAEALTKLEASRPEDRPDLLVSDVHMPEVDGVELAQRVKFLAGYENLPVVLFTAKRAEATDAYGQRAQALGYLKGAVDYEKLEVAIESRLRSERIRRRLEYAQSLLRGTDPKK